MIRVYTHNFWKTLFICLFSIYLVLPTVYVATSFIRTYHEESTRLLVQEGLTRPYFRNMAKKTNLFQDWMDASLNFRNRIVRNVNYGYWRTLGLSIYPLEVNAGKDGWFFQGKKSFTQYTGKRLLASDELDNWFEVMEARRKWLEKKGIQFYIILAPTKYYVYPEKLPFWIKKGEYTSADQLFARLPESSLRYYDGLDIVLKNKPKHRVYTTADIHWTESGAWFVFAEVEKRLKELFPDSVQWPDIAVDQHNKLSLRSSFCNLQRKLLKFSTKIACPWERPVLQGENSYTYTGKDAWQLEGWEDTDVNIWPNNTTVTVRNLDNMSGTKALVIGNSFVGAISKYLNRLFSEVSYEYIYRANGTSFFKKVAREQPDIVIIVIHYSQITDPVHL